VWAATYAHIDVETGATKFCTVINLGEDKLLQGPPYPDPRARPNVFFPKYTLTPFEAQLANLSA